MRSRNTHRLAGGLGALVTAGALLIPSATAQAADETAAPAPAATLSFPVSTGGAAMKVRNCPHLSCSVVHTFANGTVVPVDCQTTGDTVTGHLGTSNIWDVIANLGYASDTNIGTGFDGFDPNLPRC